MRHHIASREEQAKKIQYILKDFFGGETLGNKKFIEVGCGTGEISTFFADKADLVWGIEIIFSNLDNTKTSAFTNLAFSQADGAKLPFKDSLFDLVLFPQVYEHTTLQQDVINEIYRVLKPGGVCFFSGPNRFRLFEPHYFLPLLSWLPHRLSDIYLKLSKKGKVFDIYPRNYWYLKKLTKAFKRYDYTYKMIQNPNSFGLKNLVKPSFIKIFPTWLVKLLAPIYPNYNWILVKEKNI